ncbi:MAG: hypothetical protein JEZ09_19835 [Salinivirgaceae bacterium]|nr:hypothetical protein [Salinivirgaceae bacterium]
MKKITLFIAALFLLIGSSNAQTGMYDKGTQLFKVGLGYTSLGYPVEVSYEKCIRTDFRGIKGLNVGIGGYFAYFGYSEDFSIADGTGGSYDFTWGYTNIIVGARAIGHYKFIDNFDTYFGVMLGYNRGKATFDGDKEIEHLIGDPEAVGGFTYSGVVGARYEFNPKLGVYVEAGYGVANITAGLAKKF